MKRVNLLGLVLVALGAAPLAAQDVLTTDPTLPTTRTGTRGAAFLSLGVGARAQALAGAYSALADNVSALYWNTAGIAQLDGFAASVSQASLYEGLDIKHTFVGAVLPVGLGRFGVSVNTLDSGEMPWTNEGFPTAGYIDHEGNVGEMDNARAPFSWNSLAVAGHYARPVTDRLFVGAAIKYIEEGIPNAKINFVGFDVGTIFRTGLYGVTLGASLRNLGTNGRMEGKELTTRVDTRNSEAQREWLRIVDYRMGTAEAQLPTVFQFSVVTDLIGAADALIAPNPTQSLRVVWDLNDAIDTDMQTALGLEYSLRDIAFLRLGKRWYNEAQISRDFSHGASFGGGLQFNVGGIGTIGIDYAYTGMADLENIQVFTIQAKF